MKEITDYLDSYSNLCGVITKTLIKTIHKLGFTNTISVVYFI